MNVAEKYLRKNPKKLGKALIVDSFVVLNVGIRKYRMITSETGKTEKYM